MIIIVLEIIKPEKAFHPFDSRAAARTCITLSDAHMPRQNGISQPNVKALQSRNALGQSESGTSNGIHAIRGNVAFLCLPQRIQPLGARMRDSKSITCCMRGQQIPRRRAWLRRTHPQRAHSNGEPGARLLASLVDSLVQPGDRARNRPQLARRRNRAEHRLRLTCVGGNPTE